MSFFINNIIPYPIKEEKIHSESVWNNQFSIELNNNYLLKADSGRGKSTFISILYGLRNDYEGEVKFYGKNLRNLTLKDWSNIRTNKLSIVFQDMQLFPTLTVMENLKLKNNLTNHKTNSEIQQMLCKFGIENKENVLAEKLSFGQQQRVSIIRSLLQPFEFILLDEPFSHIDQGNIDIALNLITNECKKNNAGLLITSLGDNHNFKNINVLKI